MRAEQPSGELLRVVLTLARRALDGNERSDHGPAAQVRLTVKASASAAAGPGVRPLFYPHQRALFFPVPQRCQW